MTITLLAPDGVKITAQQERQARAAGHGGGSGRQLGGRSGFRVGTAADTLTATSTTWTLTPCSAAIDPGASTHQGMYGWSTDANVTGTVTAADGTNPRKDIVYIQVNDSTAGDGSGAVSADVLYLAGTPGATPTAPALPARSFLVGTITVPQVGGGSPTVVLNPARYVAAGGVLPVADLAERDALVGYEGLQVVRNGHVETYTGGAWTGRGSTAITTFGAGWSGLTGAHKPRLYVSGQMVHLVGGVNIGTAGVISDILTIPTTHRPLDTGSTFVGSNVSSGGASYELLLSNGVLSVPTGYLSGTISANHVLPVTASWPRY